ncbi:DUF5131 family protein [Streptomyces achromogenes]|uniref:DUF5131 family protein n=1 Tax=Streptomyces achromogenes TaxID=67255 RepID=UPI00367BD187
MAYAVLARHPHRAGHAPTATGAPARRRPDASDVPHGWKSPRTVFVNPMSDLFHPQVPIGFVRRVLQVMADTPQHRVGRAGSRPRRGRRRGPAGPARRAPAGRRGGRGVVRAARTAWSRMAGTPRGPEQAVALIRPPRRGIGTVSGVPSPCW